MEVKTTAPVAWLMGVPMRSPAQEPGNGSQRGSNALVAARSGDGIEMGRHLDGMQGLQTCMTVHTVLLAQQPRSVFVPHAHPENVFSLAIRVCSNICF